MPSLAGVAASGTETKTGRGLLTFSPFPWVGGVVGISRFILNNHIAIAIFVRMV
jgi:hypothetical protein